MSTDDITQISSPCLCGKGTITVTQTSPDHPWVRDSQIHYSATIDCVECQKQFVVHQGYQKFPSIVRRETIEARAAAHAKRRAAEERLERSQEAERLRGRIISAVGSQPSLAAAHRILQKYGLAYESLGTYRKRPYDGAEALRYARGETLAKIGSMPDMGCEDQSYFVRYAEEISTLRKQEESIALNPVKTNAQWMQA